jgi:hypothetical protein
MSLVTVAQLRAAPVAARGERANWAASSLGPIPPGVRR